MQYGPWGNHLCWRDEPWSDLGYYTESLWRYADIVFYNYSIGVLILVSHYDLLCADMG